MKIADSSILMSASRQYHEKTEQELSVTVWRGGRRPPAGAAGVGQAPARSPPAPGWAWGRRDLVSISSEALEARTAEKVLGCGEQEEVESEEDVQLKLIRLIMERLTGRKFHLCSAKDLAGEGGAEAPREGEGRGGPPAEPGQGWGAVLDYRESYEERETTRFHAEGVIRTADGAEIAFDVDLAMSREFVQENHLQVRMGDALKDPLVINFGGSAAQVGPRRFAFDIDCDGTQDLLPDLAPGSGFLALDANQDGVINDGSELFGPRTGQGFDELASHDTDGNGWIDENDPVYDRLRIWTRDADGNQSLAALGQKGIGAIYLGNLETQFDLTDARNALLGQVRSTGIYVGEDGSVGTVQQIDVAV